jgi:hypothetical protein
MRSWYGIPLEVVLAFNYYPQVVVLWHWLSYNHLFHFSISIFEEILRENVFLPWYSSSIFFKYGISRVYKVHTSCPYIDIMYFPLKSSNRLSSFIVYKRKVRWERYSVCLSYLKKVCWVSILRYWSSICFFISI